jgi:hypothetical protein
MAENFPRRFAGRTVLVTGAAAIPPVFEAYATIVLPYRADGQDQHDQALLALLREQSAGQPWWLGYLDTGADDIVFPEASMVTLYAGWRYVLVEGGPEQAATSRFVHHADLEASAVTVYQDATPPGHEAR